MIYHLSEYLKTLGCDIPGMGLFGYLSFRAMGAFCLALLISIFAGRKIIAWLQKKQIGETIRDLGLEDNVFLLGFKDNPYYYMRRADVFFLSSLFEGFANVLIEAMACELPVVACDCIPGPRELLAPDTDFSKSTDSISREA